MGGVIIGVDPHKASVTIEVRDQREVLRATGRFPIDKVGYRQLLGNVGQRPARTWAVEGAHGVGRPLASRLLANGETVLDVPAKLAARVRVFDIGQGRKTDATDAHAVVMVALRTPGLRQVVADEDLGVLRLLADRRDELSRRPDPDAQPTAPAPGRTDSRRRQPAPDRVAGQGAARIGAVPGSARTDASRAGCRAGRRSPALAPPATVRCGLSATRRRRRNHARAATKNTKRPPRAVPLGRTRPPPPGHRGPPDDQLIRASGALTARSAASC
jgi:hypothetical protein